MKSLNIIFPCLLVLFASCTKVINVDLNSTDPKIVIEAFINEMDEKYSVKISKSTSYFTPKAPENVVNASVTLSDTKGESYTLAHTQNGIYQTNAFPISPGEKYELTVIVDNKSYLASSTVPSRVNIEAADLHEEEVIVGFTDPKEEDNFYEIRSYINGQQFGASYDYIFSDFAYEGKYIENNLYLFDEDSEEEEPSGLELESGDVIEIRLLTIEKSSYTYMEDLFTLNESGDGFSATPYNPRTNWSNGALGFFSVNAATVKKITIP